MSAKKMTDFGMLLFVVGAVVGGFTQRRFDQFGVPLWAGVVISVAVYVAAYFAIRWYVCRHAAPEAEPVTDPSGDALYIHNHEGPGYRCGNTEWWNERVMGPINDQGCDACESAPDGTWRPLYIGEAVTR